MEVARLIMLLGVFYVHALHVLLDLFGDAGMLKLAPLQFRTAHGHLLRRLGNDQRCPAPKKNRASLHDNLHE